MTNVQEEYKQFVGTIESIRYYVKIGCAEEEELTNIDSIKETYHFYFKKYPSDYIIHLYGLGIIPEIYE